MRLRIGIGMARMSTLCHKRVFLASYIIYGNALVACGKWRVILDCRLSVADRGLWHMCQSAIENRQLIAGLGKRGYHAGMCRLSLTQHALLL